jgi:hypothetical protein
MTSNIFTLSIFNACIFVYTNTFSFNYIVYKIQLVDKRYGINLKHYLTSSFLPYKNNQLLPLLLFSCFVQTKINKSHSQRFFQDLHIYKKLKTKISNNLTKNAFESSPFHSFEQQ